MKKSIFNKQLMIVWLVLMALSVIGLAAVKAGFHGLVLSLSLLVLAIVKIQLIADWFMELRDVRLLWRMIMLGWVLAVTGLIAVAFVLTPPA